MADLENAVKKAHASPENGKPGKKVKNETDKDGETAADAIDPKLSDIEAVTANAGNIATAKTPLEEIAQAIAGKADPVKSDRLETVRGKATGIHRETATIYQFPVGGRAGLSKFRNSSLSDLERQAQEPHIDFGSWYHDDAIRDEERNDKPHS